MKKSFYPSLMLLCTLLSGLSVKATHNRAGEILYYKIPGAYTYSIVVVKYHNDGQGVADLCVDTVHFGDGTIGVATRMAGGLTGCGCSSPNGCGDLIVNDVNYRVKKSVYTIVHTYPGPGTYTICLASFSVGGTYLQSDTSTQYIMNAGFCIYPLNNNRLFAGVNLYGHTEDVSTDYGLAFAPFITYTPGKKFSVTATYYNNTGNNIIEHTGQLVVNSPDYTLDRMTASLSVAALPSTWVYCTFGFETKEDLMKRFYYHYGMVLLGVKVFPSLK